MFTWPSSAPFNNPPYLVKMQRRFALFASIRATRSHSRQSGSPSPQSHTRRHRLTAIPPRQRICCHNWSSRTAVLRPVAPSLWTRGAILVHEWNLSVTKARPQEHRHNRAQFPVSCGKEVPRPCACACGQAGKGPVVGVQECRRGAQILTGIEQVHSPEGLRAQ